MSDDDWTECDRCGAPKDDDLLTTIDVLDRHTVCLGCADDLSESIEHYDVADRYTDEQHQRAVQTLAERDEIECVIESYEDRAIVVHTPYVSSNVVEDVCFHFNLDIDNFGIVWEQEAERPCVEDHGSTFEIVLRYPHHAPAPTPMAFSFDWYAIDELDENDRQF